MMSCFFRWYFWLAVFFTSNKTTMSLGNNKTTMS